MAQTRVEAIEQKAVVQIEMSCLKAQEQLALAGLTSDAAIRFVEQLPSVESLMPGRALPRSQAKATRRLPSNWSARTPCGSDATAIGCVTVTERYRPLRALPLPEKSHEGKP